MIRQILISGIIIAITGTSAQAQGYSQLRPKSPTKASNLSLGGTLLPTAAGIAVLAAEPDGAAQVAGATSLFFGLIVGPSLGHAYARNGDRCLFGIGFRTVIIGATTALIFTSDDHGSIGPDEGDMGVLLFVAVMVAVSSIWDIAAAPGSVREYNRKNGLGEYSVTPTFDPVKKQVGLRVSLSI